MIYLEKIFDVVMGFGNRFATHCTGPSSSILAFVSGFSGVEARTQTPPFDNLIAVERPPTGMIPKRAKGLGLASVETYLSAGNLKVQTERKSRHSQRPGKGGWVRAIKVEIYGTSRITVNLSAIRAVEGGEKEETTVAIQGRDR